MVNFGVAYKMTLSRRPTISSAPNASHNSFQDCTFPKGVKCAGWYRSWAQEGMWIFCAEAGAEIPLASSACSHFFQSCRRSHLIHTGSIIETKMPLNQTGSLVPRKWAWILASSSLTLALCTWLYYRSRARNSSSTKPNSFSLSQTWLWLRSFVAIPSTGRFASSSDDSRPVASQGPESTDNHHSNSMGSANSVDSAMEALYRARISGNPRVVVLSTRHVRHFLDWLRS